MCSPHVTTRLVMPTDHSARGYGHEQAYTTYKWTDGPDEDVSIWHTQYGVIAVAKASASCCVSIPRGHCTDRKLH